MRGHGLGFLWGGRTPAGAASSILRACGKPRSFISRAVSSRVSNSTVRSDSLMRPETYQAWYDQTPPQFPFALKGSRYITHLKRLRDVGTALANFYASGVLRLRDKLGPFLWQLPPAGCVRRR